MTALRSTRRKPPSVYRADAAAGWALLRRAPVVRVAAATSPPLLRTLHHAIVDGALFFHGGRVGEKNAMVGREVTLAAEEHVATLPSYFFDTERACPATTYYRSVHARGRVTEVDDLPTRARAMAALMAHHQPEGRHVPIHADHPLYAGPLSKLAVLRVEPTWIEARFKLGQNKPAAMMARVLHALWRRGSVGDLDALRAIREAHPADLQAPFLQHGDVRFEVAPDDVHGAVALVRDEYWNEGIDVACLEAAHRRSDAWITGHDARGVACTARAIGDGKRAWIYDVAVRTDRRGQGLGHALMRLLLDHPAVRGTHQVLLGTRDAQPFYAGLGFGLLRPRSILMER